jgi:hypothetical protein
MKPAPTYASSLKTPSHDESCVDPRTCQKSLLDLKNNGKNILFLNLIAIGAKNIASMENGQIDAAENESSGGHPKWTHLAALQISGDGTTDDEIVYIDPTVWVQTGLVVTCSAPCTMVIPPSSLPSASVITFPSLITTLEVGWTGADGQFTGVTQTTTLSIPVLTVTMIDYWNVVVTGTLAPSNIYPTMSILPSPFTITNSLPPGAPGTGGTRVITPPPYPWGGSYISSSPSGSVVSYNYDGITVYVTGTSPVTY